MFKIGILDRITINKLLNCKVIVKAGVGYDNIDICAAGNIGIPVINVPNYGTSDVADHTFALFLSYVKKLGFIIIPFKRILLNVGNLETEEKYTDCQN